MELKDLMSISGYPGLYRFISQGRNSIIVESIQDKKRMSAYQTSRISNLEEISVFTDSGEISLSDLLRKIYSYTGGKEVVSHKSSGEQLKMLFEEVLPDYDRERVYTSDMKKIISWYNILVRFDLLHPSDESEDKDKVDAGSEPNQKGPEKEENRSE